MNISWTPVIVIDITGSVVVLLLAICCAFQGRKWSLKKPEDIFRQYILLLTLAFVFFAVSRSFGHLVKQFLLLNDLQRVWLQISPFSGAVNSAAFIVIFAFGIYFHRFQKVHLQIENYQNNLEQLVLDRTAELEEANVALEREVTERHRIGISLQEALRQTEDEIDERKHIESALKESEGRLQAIISNTTLPIYLKDFEGRYIIVNPQFEKMIRGSNEDIKGENDFDLFPEPVARLFRSQDEEVKRRRVPLEFEETIPLADGDHTFILSKFPLLDVDDNLYAVGCVCTDITHRKRAENKLAAEQEQLAVTLRSIGDGVITTDTDGKIVLINQVAEKLTGWRQAEAIGKPLQQVFDIVDEQNKIPCANPVEKVIACGQNTTLAKDTTLIARDGTERNISDSGAPIRDRESRIIGVVLVFRDVTEKNRMEADVHKIKKLESIGVLAGGIAHDFNNILAAILGNISLALHLCKQEDKVHELLMGAEKASLRAKDLTQQLLTFSKGGEPVKRIAAIDEVIKDSAGFVLRGGGVRCEYQFDDHLWLVEIDTGQMSQVIQNIVINASQAMPDGGIVGISCRNIVNDKKQVLSLSPGRYIKIQVKDNGVGISAAAIEKIFDPYFSTKRQGSGLGLAITHSIVSKHDGHISVESSPGTGTTFTVYLPASSENIPPAFAETEPAILEGHGRILIMDDEEMVRDIAGSILSQAGFEALFAEDGREAIKIYKEALGSEKPLDVIIMDLTIPGGMGGEEAVKEILKIDRNARIIVSSGYSNDPIMANYLEYGFCAALTKPYRLDEFVRVVGRVMMGH